MSKIIDGNFEANKIKNKLLHLRQKLDVDTGIQPGLAVIRVGSDPASRIFVGLKGEKAKELGYHFEEHAFPSSVSLNVIEETIKELNFAPHIHGIILQLPVPRTMDKFHLLSLLDPSKDVDGLHPLNAGKLFQGLHSGFVACTPLGCLTLIKTVHEELKGLTVGIVGSSILVGRPMAMLMLQQGCTPWIANSKTKNLPELCATADILIVAIGRARFIQGNWIKEGATVIDVGINRMANGEVVGDVDFIEAQKRAGAITPVPGGVGPMTVITLMRNTLQAAYQYVNHPFPL